MRTRIGTTRRILGAFALACAGLAAGSMSPPRSGAVAIPTYAYLAGGTGHYVNVIDDATKTLSTTIGPFNANSNWRCNRQAAFGAPDGSRVLQAATCQANGVMINTTTNTYTNLSWSGTAASFSPDSQYVYVTSAYYRNAYKVSDGSNVWGVMSPCYRPYSTQWSIATSQDGSKIYIPYQGSCSSPAATFNQVDVLDASNGSTVATITNASMTSPSWTVAAPTGNRVYVGSNGNINVIDTLTDTVVASWAIGHNSPVTVSTDGAHVYVASGSVIKKIDSTNGNELTSYAVSTGECGISLNPAGTHLYALTNSCNTLTIVRLSDSTTSSINLPPGESSRNIAWGTVTPAPSISLSASSGTATIGVAASSLYTISNSGGPTASYSISPALPAGLSFSSSTGLVSGTPTATQSATSHTITAVNSGGTSTATFSLTVVNQPPTTTTTTTTTTAPPTTTTVVAATTTTAADSVGLQSGPATSIVASATPIGTTTTLATTTDSDQPTAGTDNARVKTTAPASATTVPPTTTTVAIAPEAPTVSAGESAATVDGVSVPVELTRRENAVVLSGAGITATVSGMSADGTRINLDEDGTLRLRGDDRIVVDASGYAASEDVEVWLFSTPNRLGTVTTDANGRFSNNFELPPGIAAGSHRLVLSGNTDDDDKIILSLGINFGPSTAGGSVSTWAIAIPVALAVFVGLLIPAARRRRTVEDGSPTSTVR